MAIMSSNIESNKADPESNEEIIVAEAHFENNLDARTVAPVGTNERGNDVEATSAVMVEPMAEQVVSRQPEPCCCDARRGVIIIDVVLILVCVYSLVATRFHFDSWFHIGIGTGGHDPATAREDVEVFPYFFVDAIFNGLTIFFAAMGIGGAAMYNRYLVLLPAIALCGLTIFSILGKRWFGLNLSALCICLHSVLFQQLSTGRITPENYSHEKHSCCCI